MDEQNQVTETLDISVTDDETKKREEIANDFNVLISRIKVPFQSILILRKNKIKPDYSNAQGLEVFENGEWSEWEDNYGFDIDNTEEA